MGQTRPKGRAEGGREGAMKRHKGCPEGIHGGGAHMEWVDGIREGPNGAHNGGAV